MDTTQPDPTLVELAEADPADAPDVADRFADRLAAELEAAPAEDDG